MSTDAIWCEKQQLQVSLSERERIQSIEAQPIVSELPLQTETIW